jgi:peroxiredoxin Q/BCP
VTYAHRVVSRLISVSVVAFILASVPTAADPQTPTLSAPPAVGDKAPDFALTAVDGTTVTLSAEWKRGPVVLVVLRGWPGYQCPFCVLQYGDFITHRDKFSAAGARVIWVYPGPAGVKQRADAFAANADAPTNFRLTLDPLLKFTQTYHLRWEGDGETSYPSTFVIDKTGVVRWAQVSKTHGGRARATDVLSALSQLGR